jgi:hypothetical protein
MSAIHSPKLISIVVNVVPQAKAGKGRRNGSKNRYFRLTLDFFILNLSPIKFTQLAAGK